MVSSARRPGHGATWLGQRVDCRMAISTLALRGFLCHLLSFCCWRVEKLLWVSFQKSKILSREHVVMYEQAQLFPKTFDFGEVFLSMVKIQSWHWPCVWTTGGAEESVCGAEARGLIVPHTYRDCWAGTLAMLTLVVFRWKDQEALVQSRQKSLYIYIHVLSTL